MMTTGDSASGSGSVGVGGLRLVISRPLAIVGIGVGSISSVSVGVSTIAPVDTGVGEAISIGSVEQSGVSLGFQTEVI